MSLNDFKDTVFDIFNDTEELTLRDITVDDADDRLNLYLEDGSIFSIQCRKISKSL